MPGHKTGAGAVSLDMKNIATSEISDSSDSEQETTETKLKVDVYYLDGLESFCRSNCL